MLLLLQKKGNEMNTKPQMIVAQLDGDFEHFELILSKNTIAIVIMFENLILHWPKESKKLQSKYEIKSFSQSILCVCGSGYGYVHGTLYPEWKFPFSSIQDWIHIAIAI